MPNKIAIVMENNKSRATCFMFAVVIAVLLCIHSSAQEGFNYPLTPIRPVSDTLFGKIVTDNYRWLEYANNPEVQAWLQKQADLTNKYLDRISGRNILLDEYKKLDEINAVNISNVSRKANRYFYIKTFRGENVGKLYYRQGETGKEILLFDPSLYSRKQAQSKEITFSFVPSNDGTKVAVGLTDNGKLNILTVKFLNVNTKTFYSDSLYPVLSPQAWTPDGNGVIYGELQTTDPLSPKFFVDIPLKVHRLGSTMKEDKILLSRTTHPYLDMKSHHIPFLYYSPDYKYLAVDLWGSPPDQAIILFLPATAIEKGDVNWKCLTQPEDEVRQAVIYGENVYMVTKKNAPNRKVITTPLDNLDIASAKTVIPENNELLEWIALSKDYLFVHTTDGINSSIGHYQLSTGAKKTVKLPQSGSVSLQTLDARANDFVMWVTSWKQPEARYRYNPLSGKSAISPLYPKITYPGTDELVVEEIEAKSHDGTMVPLSLIYNKNIKRNGKNVVYLTGYGSYGISFSPWFEPTFLPLLRRGVVIAVSHPRGGGEKGHAWHMGGFKATKPNTWKDFIACAEYLIANGYTSAEHLIGEGRSAGGILIGRAMTERPELFAATINNFPVSNALRGENRPNGELDAQENGTAKDSAEAMGLIEMDAYLHVSPGTNYPAVIAVTGINDTGVPVWQPAKFVAALQQANASDRPVLLMVNYDSGHLSEEKFVTYRILANTYSLALWQAGHKDFQPAKKLPD